MPYRDRHPLAQPVGGDDVRTGLLPRLDRRGAGPGRPSGAGIDYHVADVYDAVEVLGRGAYDLVFTGIGALGWLPDIGRWGQVVATLLRPGGRLFLREGHPVLWSLADPRPDDVVAIEYPYFEQVSR